VKKTLVVAVPRIKKIPQAATWIHDLLFKSFAGLNNVAAYRSLFGTMQETKKNRTKNATKP
jgi:hypothetical protein